MGDVDGHDGGADRTATRRRRWERFAPAGALGFLLTIAIGALVIGEGTPSNKAPAEDIAAYFAEHRGARFLNATLVVMGAFALYPWFLASLNRAIRRAEGDDGLLAVVAFIGGLTLLGPHPASGCGVGSGRSEAGPSRDASVAAGLMDLGNMGFLLVPFPAGVADLVAHQPGGEIGILLSVWLARAGLVVAPGMILGGVVGLLPRAPFAVWPVAFARPVLHAPPGGVKGGSARRRAHCRGDMERS